MGRDYLNYKLQVGSLHSALKQIVALSSIACLFITSACADRPYYNDKKVPNAEDLMVIEKSLKSSLPKARAATVCIKMGEGSGSGVIVNEEGLILTAAHVSVGVGKDITVIMEDGTEHNAVSLGLHSETDAAMIQITDKGKYPFVEIEAGKLAATASTKLGDWVFSLGHSGGYDKDRGSVVRLGRLVRIADHTVQSDCKLIGGDSGGPLFDMNGVLVGIHSRVGKVIDINLHVPMHVYHTHWDQMKNNEFIGEGPFAQKPVLGSGFIGIAVEKADKGLKIIDVDEETPAGKVGVKKGDVLIKVDATEMKKRDDLVKYLKTKAEGDSIELTVLRGGEEKKFKLKLGTR